ncbi:hypothetical protein [Flavobacterium sp. N1994]|uniref:hypothetical protein n=1 Tax=Flavobacterium sp. N1994 TaxID=2986827 RepID=UPI002222379B|nr:hypothetical protein [Flavobacterium sp. N1994]
MAKLLTKEFFKARFYDLLAYPLRDMMILREISGFTKEALKTSPQYENCRKTASEFGRVSSLCKEVRVALKGILPQQNNLVVVNTFTKKMRGILNYDTLNEKGNRELATAFSTQEGRELLLGYEFNPDTKMVLDYALLENTLEVNLNTIIFTKYSNSVGFRVHNLVYNFRTNNHEAVSSDWVFESKVSLPEKVVLELPSLPNAEGTMITLVETQFYKVTKKGFVSMEDDRTKSVQVVGVKEV